MNPAAAIREALRADLKTAMLGKDRARAALIRTLIAAIDNAEALEATAEQKTESFRKLGDPSGEVAPKLGDPSGEVARRVLARGEVVAVLDAEVASRREAAAQFRAGGNEGEAARLEAEAQVVGAYRDGASETATGG